MIPRSHRQAAVLVCLAWFATACAVLGVPTPESFNERAAAAYATTAAVRDSATDLLVAGRISVEDAENVQAQADNVRAGIDIARLAYAGDPPAAEDRLNAAIRILSALDVYLRSREQ